MTSFPVPKVPFWTKFCSLLFLFSFWFAFRSVVSVYIDDMAFGLFQILNFYKVMKSWKRTSQLVQDCATEETKLRLSLLLTDVKLRLRSRLSWPLPFSNCFLCIFYYANIIYFRRATRDDKPPLLSVLPLIRVLHYFHSSLFFVRVLLASAITTACVYEKPWRDYLFHQKRNSF